MLSGMAANSRFATVAAVALSRTRATYKKITILLFIIPQSVEELINIVTVEFDRLTFGALEQILTSLFATKM